MKDRFSGPHPNQSSVYCCCCCRQRGEEGGGCELIVGHRASERASDRPTDRLIRDEKEEGRAKELYIITSTHSSLLLLKSREIVVPDSVVFHHHHPFTTYSHRIVSYLISPSLFSVTPSKRSREAAGFKVAPHPIDLSCTRLSLWSLVSSSLTSRERTNMQGRMETISPSWIGCSKLFLLLLLLTKCCYCYCWRRCSAVEKMQTHTRRSTRWKRPLWPPQ